MLILFFISFVYLKSTFKLYRLEGNAWVGNLLVSMLELSISPRCCALVSILIHILKKNKKMR